MKILITTPGGNIGRRVLWELLAPEFSVRVLARNPARLPEEIREQAQVVRGSVEDAGTLRRALEGVDALFWCVPPHSVQETNVLGHYESFARAARAAIREARTPRVVTISAGGKGLARNAGALSGLHAMEEIINESGAAIRHIRCAPFMDNFLRQLHSIRDHAFFRYPMPGNIPIPMAAAEDIADVALRLLARPNWKGIESVPVHGPQDLSYHQAAAVMAQVLDRPVRYREVPANKYVQSLVESGTSLHHATSLVEMFGELAAGILRAEPRTAASTTRTTLAGWIERELLPMIEPLSPHGRAEGTCGSMCEVESL